MEYSVDGHPNLYRDSMSGAIVNKNVNEYNSYIQDKYVKVNNIKRIENLEVSVESIKDDLSEIKSLLRSLVNESRWN